MISVVHDIYASCLISSYTFCSRKVPQDLPVPISRLPLAFEPHVFETPLASRKIVQFSSSLVSAPRAYETPPIATLADPMSPEITVPSDQPELGPEPVRLTAFSPTRKPLSSEPFPNIPDSSSSESPASVSKNSRPLRPLASFLDQFLETARLATTSSASSQAHTRPRPRPRKPAPTRKSDSITGDHLKPLNTINIQSFFRGSLQSPVSSSPPPVGLRKLTAYPHPDLPSDSSYTKPGNCTQRSPTESTTDTIEILPALYSSPLVHRSARNSRYTPFALPIPAPSGLLPPPMQDTIEPPSQNALSPFLAATHVSFSPDPDREIVSALLPLPQYQILLSCDPSVSSSQLTSSFIF